MFQFDWASKYLWFQEQAILNPQETRLSPQNVRYVMLLQWQEHCLECAIPQCYGNCQLYVERADKKCARLVYGIIRNPDFRGKLHCGADLRFRRWGKIEALLTGRAVSLTRNRFLDNVDRVLTLMVNTTASFLSPVNPKRRLNGALTFYRSKLLGTLGHLGKAWDAFVVECFNCEPQPIRLIVELRKKLVSIMREGLNLQPGQNFFSIPIKLPANLCVDDDYLLMIYPEGDREIRLIFTWLDFIIYHPNTEPVLTMSVSYPSEKQASYNIKGKPADKVKCVAWDLDNTLWNGILVEDGEENIKLRPKAVDLIRRLDERGILQTIVSKNNHDDAMGLIRKYELEDYFLYPAINWGQKSANLQQIAYKLNINIDTFALIDDSPFERLEVSHSLPMVRTFPEEPLEELLSLPEFEVPITETSRKRRQSYLTENQRERASEEFAGDYLEFLRSCALKLQLFVPNSQEEIARCLELIQRSNQLNLSSRRYNTDQFSALLSDPHNLCVAMRCEDKFGDYGIVGFASIDRRSDAPIAKDFVLSCRVAQKMVEHTFYAWLGRYFRQTGAQKLLVELIKTPKNRPLVKVFEDLPFTTVRANGDQILLAMELTNTASFEPVIEVDDSSIISEAIL